MQIYLVGGAIRDRLSKRPHHEKDWVVVGSTPEEMATKGFKPVGKDFPVFLHPKTHEEYALARTERKVSKGYKGFQVYAAPEVTLEEDLRRRDLTINAIAEDETGNIIDPFHGQQDLKDHVLRHVSDAFIEDPVRILRIARFAAKLGDFTVAPETMTLMKKMVESGEVNALVPERVFQELNRALSEEHPNRFFEVLRECGALKVIFPELDALYGVPNPPQHHPEVDSFIHTMLALQQAVKLSNDNEVRFAVLVHDFGKALTPKDKLPKHHGHAEKGVPLVRIFCGRIHAPKDYEALAVLVTRHHIHCLDSKTFGPEGLLRLLNNLDAFRRPERFEKVLIACEADVRGRKGLENVSFEAADFLRNVYRACASVNIAEAIEDLPKEKIANKVQELRLSAIENFLKN